MKRAIVLSGGGGKGAYQIGVWKALRKLHLKYDIVTGTSVGALNGAYMVQKEYVKALLVWKHMGFGKVYNTEIEQDITTTAGKKEVVTMYAKGIVIDGGMNIQNLEKLIDNSINEKKFKGSNINYGLITVNLSKLKSVSITKNEIPDGKLKDYLLASAACFPVFKKKEIGTSAYIDGGIVDNLPINLALELGAEEVIAVDLRSLGIKHKIKKTDAKITIISPRNKINSFLVFEEKSSNRAIKLGYNDAMKTFGKLDGNKFTFKKGQLNKNYKKHGKMFIETIHDIFHFTHNKNLMDKLVTISAFNKIFKKETESEILKLMDTTMEYLGSRFEMNDENIYDVRMFNRVLLDKLDVKSITNEIGYIDKLIKIGNVKTLLNTTSVIQYIYIKMRKAEEDRRSKKELSSLALVFSKEFLGALYLYCITSK